AGTQAAEVMCDRPGPVAEALAGTGHDALVDPEHVGRVLHTVGRSFLNFSVVAKREAEMRGGLSARAEVLARIPYFDVDIYDLSGLLAMGAHLFEGAPKT
ncbi:MAG TPA: hypothetical protein VM618_01410, partial [Acidimicrobiia bacterium]|nr:hypothetical protein [Acidimicrobiia bacterium]